MWKNTSAAPPSTARRSKPPRLKLGMACRSHCSGRRPRGDLAGIRRLLAQTMQPTDQGTGGDGGRRQATRLDPRRAVVHLEQQTHSHAEAQLFINLGTSTPQTLLTDRRLGHKFWKVPSLGPKAVEEEWAIFALKDGVWLTMSIVRLDQWPPYKQRLVVAAQEAVSRIGQVVHPKSAA